MNKTLDWIFSPRIAFLLLLFCVLTRFLFTSFPVFSGDEAMHAKRAVTVAVGMKNFITLNDPQTAINNIIHPIFEHNHPPLEFLVLIPFGLIEPREIFARLVYAGIGSLVMVVSYFWIRSLLGLKAAVIFLILYGTSAYIIWWTQTAMYQSLAIGAGMLIATSMLNFYKKASEKSLTILLFTQALGLLVFQDFVFYIPAIFWLMLDKKLALINYIRPVTILLFTAGIYYFLYIYFAFSWGLKSAGFNYAISQKLNSQVDIFKNILGYWNNFFGYAGVLTVWPLSILGFFQKKDLGINKYFFLIIFIFLVVYIVKSPTPFFYFSSILGIFILLATRYLITIKNVSFVALGLLIINLATLISVFRSPNPQIYDAKASSDIKSIGQIAKSCITNDNETYISTSDAWLTAYYFGRNSTLERDGDEERLATVDLFLNGYADQVKLIHLRKDLVDNKTHNALLFKALKTREYEKDLVFIFKDC